MTTVATYFDFRWYSGAMQKASVIVLLVGSAAQCWAQTDPAYTNVANCTGSPAVPAACVELLLGPNSNVAPIAPVIWQPARWGLGLSSFTGNAVQDAVTYSGYNYQPGAGVARTSVDPWAAAWVGESDFTTALSGTAPNGGTAISSVATTGTSTTMVDDSAKSWGTNEWVGYVLFDTTRSASCNIGASTATSYTCVSGQSIAGAVSGDSYQILERDTEQYLSLDLFATINHEVRPFMFTENKSQSISTGSIVVNGSRYECFGGNGCQFTDSTTNNTIALIVPNFGLILEPQTSGGGSNLLMRTGTGATESQMFFDYGASDIPLGHIQANAGVWNFYARSSTGSNETRGLAFSNSGSALQMTLGDASESGSTTTINAGSAGNITATAPTIISNGYTILTLPTCGSALRGANAYVTNGQASPTYLGVVSTTGSTVAPVFCNGAGWVYH